jgi:nuclease S1
LHAWGQLGHSVIAELAQRHLSPAAQAALKTLIGITSLASLSNWADDYKFTAEGKGTYRWHFVDIDIAHPAYDATIDCFDKNNQGTCIVKGLPVAIAMLKDNAPARRPHPGLEAPGASGW